MNKLWQISPFSGGEFHMNEDVSFLKLLPSSSYLVRFFFQFLSTENTPNWGSINKERLHQQNLNHIVAFCWVATYLVIRRICLKEMTQTLTGFLETLNKSLHTAVEIINKLRLRLSAISNRYIMITASGRNDLLKWRLFSELQCRPFHGTNWT